MYVRDLCKLYTQHATTGFTQSATSGFTRCYISVYFLFVQLGLERYFFTLGLPGHFESFLGPQTGN